MRPAAYSSTGDCVLIAVEANELLERVAGLANDVGLFAEENIVADAQSLGNFPQAFTHLDLIAADRRLRECATVQSPVPMERADLRDGPSIAPVWIS